MYDKICFILTYFFFHSSLDELVIEKELSSKRVLLPVTKVKNIRYPGDIKNNRCLSPKSSQSAIEKLQKTLQIEKAKVHCLQQRLYRSNKSKTSMKSLLENLKMKTLISDRAHTHIRQVLYKFNIIIIY